MATRYRQIVSPVGLEVANQDTGGSQAAMELSDALSSFARVGNEFTGQLRAEQGATEGEAAGAAGAPQTRTGLRANTAYGRAYNSAAEAAYSSKMQTDIAAEYAKLEQDHEADLDGFNTVAAGYAEKLVAEAPPEYRVRVQQAIAARHAAGAARVRDQQMAFERAKHGAAYLEGGEARANLAIAAAMNLPREDGDAALAAAAEDNRLQLDALVAEHIYTPLEAVKLQDAFMQSLDDGLFAQRTQPVVDALMNEAKTDVLKGDKLLTGVMADESIPLDERLTIRKAYDAQRTALAEDRSRAGIAESTALAQRLAADESGAGVDGESWKLYRAGKISDAEHTGNLRKSVENGKKKVEDDSDIAAVMWKLQNGQGLDPGPGSKDRAALNKVVDRTVAASNMQPGDDRWTQFMIDVSKESNIMPQAAESWARVNLMSDEPVAAAKGAAFFSRLQKENPIAWDYNADPKLASFGEQFSQNLGNSILPERAYEMARKNVYEMTKEQKDILQQQYGSKKDALGDNQSALIDALNEDENFDPGVFRSSPDAGLALQAEYNNLVSQYYVSTNGDIKTARNLAGKAVRSRYGVTEVNGTREIMKYAPERMYPGLSAAVIRDDMMKSVASIPNAPAVIDPAKMRLVPEGRGRTERTRGLEWNIVVLDEEGDYDVIRGPDNKPLVYALPLGEDFSSVKERLKAEQLVEAAAADEAARKRDPLYRDLARENLDDVQR